MNKKKKTKKTKHSNLKRNKKTSTFRTLPTLNYESQSALTPRILTLAYSIHVLSEYTKSHSSSFSPRFNFLKARSSLPVTSQSMFNSSLSSAKFPSSFSSSFRSHSSREPFFKRLSTVSFTNSERL